MPAPRCRRRLNRMYPQLLRDALQAFNINIVHEYCLLYAQNDKRKVEFPGKTTATRLHQSRDSNSVW
jgi:hypothetical protein